MAAFFLSEVNMFSPEEIEHGENWLQFFQGDWRDRIRNIVMYLVSKGYMCLDDDEFKETLKQTQEAATSLLYAAMKDVEAGAVCTCKDWEPSMAKINGPIILQQLRAGHAVPADHFNPFKFCPWCGNRARTHVT